jgi:DNA-binding SARP family transcriptional activator
MSSALAPAAQRVSWQLRLLGPPAWRHAGQPAWQRLPRKDAALLARLALDGPQRRSPLAAWLWPEVALPRAHANLRQRLLRLRLQAGDLVHESDGLLQLNPEVACDYNAAGCSHDATLDAPLLAGVDDGADLLQAWLDDARRQALARRADLMLGRASQLESRGELAAALALTERLLVLEPLLEHGWRRLMRLHSQRGDRAAALAAFERCEQVLRDELGVRPDAETLACLHAVESGQGGVPAPSSAAALPPSLVRPPRLVGRESERQAMAAAWQAGTAFVLLGDAGIGKSRLLLDWAAAGPGRIIEAALPGDEAVPYAALVRVLRKLQRHAPRPDALWPDADTAAVERRELARLLPELGPAPAAPGLQALLMAALEAVFQRAPAAGVQAVLVDDLQHADDASLAVLQRASALPGLRWGFASRPDARAVPAQWLAASSRVQGLRLPALRAEALQELLLSCQLQAMDRPGLAQDLARHCEGNPLFVLETLRHLVQQGPLAGGEAGALPMPPSVEALLSQRLASLPPDAQALARVAAVAGSDFCAELAADVLEQPLLTLAAPWQALEAAQVLQRAGFLHPLLLEAARRSLPEALRQPLHARVAHGLRRRQAEAQRVALHFEAAGLWAEAGEMQRAAAARARSLGQLQAWREHLDRAADLYRRSGDADAALAARSQQVMAVYALDGVAPALALLDGLLAEARTRDVRVAMQLERAGLLLSQYQGVACHAAAEAARTEAAAGSVDELAALLLGAAGLSLAGEAPAAVATAGPLRARLQALGDELRATNLWGYLAVVYAQAGHSDECVYALQVQRRLAQAAGQADDEATARASLVGQYLQRGEAELAVAEGREAVALQRRLGAVLAAAGSQLNLALAQTSLWALREALHTLGQVHEACATLPGAGPELACIAQDTEAEAWLRAQAPEHAWAAMQPFATGALSAPRQVGRLAQQARVLQALGRGDEARLLWRQVLAATPGALPVLRGQLLAVLALGDEAARRLPALCEAAASAPAAYRALAAWVEAERAWRQRDIPTALAAAARLSALLPQARHIVLPEAEVRAGLCALRQALDTTEGARAALAEWQRWQHQVQAPAVRALVRSPV